MSDKYSSSFSFIDVLFNTLLALMFVLVMALLLVNPKVPVKHNAEVKGEYQIILEWDNQSGSDFDLWVKDSVGNIVSFLNKQNGIMFLDLDDLGSVSDYVVTPTGEVKRLEINREVVTLRGTIDGEYSVGVHFFGRKDTMSEYNIKVTLLRINPYRLVTLRELKFTENEAGAEKSAFRFKVKNNDVVTFSDLDDLFILEKVDALRNTYPTTRPDTQR